MKSPYHLNYPLVLTILVLSIFYWTGVASVPFHPDEATQIFMSADFQEFFQTPSALFWQPNQMDQPRQNYRLLDAPLTRNLIGLGLQITERQPISTDWDWSATWEQNLSSGALPGTDLLWISRLSVCFLFPLSLLFIYSIGTRLLNPLAGWLALILFATNNLILLHTRRAMAESALAFCVLLIVWLSLRKQSIPWLYGIAAAFAVSAKQSAVGLAAILLAAIPISFVPFWPGLKRTGLRVLIFLLTAVTVCWLLNPFLWQYPVQAFTTSIYARNELVNRQTAEFAAAQPDLQFLTIGERSVVLLTNLFFSPLQFEEVGNYTKPLSPSRTAYQRNLLNTWNRSLWIGSLFLFLSLLGMLIGISKSLHRKNEPHPILFLMIMTVTQFMVLAIWVPLPFQRYTIPLVPFACIWEAYCLGSIIQSAKNKTPRFFRQVE